MHFASVTRLKMYLAVFLYLAYFSGGVLAGAYSDNVAEDARLTAPQLIVKYGYTLEIHTVTTSDGYILTLFRIPCARGANPCISKASVFLFHGLLTSSISWLLNGPGFALAYLLADNGYDVWLANARGTKYSRNHTFLNPKESRYWQFSWHEIAVYDLPTNVDYILSKTGRSKCHYIGHSQGATVLFAFLALFPKYSNKFISIRLFSPVAFLKHAGSLLLQGIAPLEKEIGLVAHLLGVNEFLPKSELITTILVNGCVFTAAAPGICAVIPSLFGSGNYAQLNQTMEPIYAGAVMQGSSMLQVRHYLQLVNSGKFCQYDHGIENMKIYNLMVPPDYPIERICANITMYYCDNDMLVAVVDMMKLYNIIKRVCDQTNALQIPIQNCGHIDPVIAIDIREKLYYVVIASMDEET